MIRRIAILLLAGSLALTACAAENTEASEDDIARIEQTLIRGSELSWELTQAESRVASMCMQNKGFTVHDPLKLIGNTIPYRFVGFQSAYTRIPNVEQAELFGFGMFVHFTDTDAAQEMSDNPGYLAYSAELDGWEDPDWDTGHEEFDAMDQEYQDDWMEAFLGPEGFAADQAAEESEETIDEGPPGGCELETVEVIYGEVDESEDEDGIYLWQRPQAETPLTEIGEEGFSAQFAEQHADQEAEFLACIDERGYGEWEFDGYGGLPVWDYLNLVYGQPYGLPSDPEVTPELTDEAEDTEDPVAYEFAMALDFAECAESEGLRDVEDEWAHMYADPLLERETELYAWEKQIEEYLANAQAYIAG